MKELTAQELKTWMDEGKTFQLIDIREDYEREVSNIGGNHIPMGQVLSRTEEIDRDKEVVIYCRSGGRSGVIVQQLSTVLGLENLNNLKGGMQGWKASIDPTIEVA
ncbi:MAG: rhodanese-like domain-containing protein [Bacteroidia bacterium]|nr:rhodanese-like domain-containing protein [Bacteroidia bacterium]